MYFTTKEIFTTLSNLLPDFTEKDIEDFMGITTYKKVGKNKTILKSRVLTKKAFLILNGTVRGTISKTTKASTFNVYA